MTKSGLIQKDTKEEREKKSRLHGRNRNHHNKIPDQNSNILIITLNINEQNTPTRRKNHLLSMFLCLTLLFFITKALVSLCCFMSLPKVLSFPEMPFL